MGNKEPVEGKCNTRLRGERKGQYCSMPPMKGARRCRMHGGKRGGQKPVHGRYSKDFKNLAKEGRDRLEEIYADPELLNPRRPVALAPLLVESAAFPTRELAERLAKARAAQSGLGEVVEDDIRIAMGDLALQYQKQVQLLGQRQESAVKQAHATELLTQSVMPLITEFTQRVLAIAQKHLPEEAQATLRDDLRRAVEATAAQVLRL